MVSNSFSFSHVRWRVVDITVASVIGVAAAFVYWIYALQYGGLSIALKGILPGLDGSLNGVWFIAGTLAAIIVRKPGAALYAEIIGGVLESFLGNQWGGVDTFLAAFAQGLGAEIAFLIVAYKKWNLSLTILSGALAGVGGWLKEFIYNQIGLVSWAQFTYMITTIISGAIISGVLMWLLYIAIAKTGALDKFASGRSVRAAA